MYSLMEMTIDLSFEIKGGSFVQWTIKARHFEKHGLHVHCRGGLKKMGLI